MLWLKCAALFADASCSDIKLDQLKILKSLEEVTQLQFRDMIGSTTRDDDAMSSNGHASKSNKSCNGSKDLASCTFKFERKESHSNHKRSYQIVPHEQIALEVMPLYEKALALCHEHRADCVHVNGT